MDDIDLLFQIFRFRNGTVGDPRTGNDQKVTVCHCTVCIGFSVISQHSEVQRVVFRHNADAHHRCYKRDIVLLTELADTLLAVSEDNTAAGTDQRLFRFIDRSDHFMHLWVISLCTWLVSADIDLGRVVEGLL